jgi:hypothetical protein
MREDRSYGHESPRGRVEVVHAAANLYCSICDARPCYLFATAAVAVTQEQLTESDGDNLEGAVRYVQSLQKLQSCLTRHLEVAHEAWQLDKHFRVTERALRALSEDGMNDKEVQGILQNTHNGDPPIPMYN